MVEQITLHVRLTKQCNADCYYCSSWVGNNHDYMDPEEYSQSLNFIYRTLEKNNIKPQHITIEYVGGEILLVNSDKLEKMVREARDFFQSKNISIRDGAQSNLIGSKRKIDDLFNLFDGRIGTSIDTFYESRTVKGSPGKYKKAFDKSDKNLKKNKSFVAPAVFTMDDNNKGFVYKEIDKAEKERRDLNIRPVFRGGSEDISFVSESDLSEIMSSIFSYWFMKKNIRLEPFASLLERWLILSKSFDEIKNNSNVGAFCPFQNDCAKKSISLEPNGDLYICQEMGDAGMYKLGNTLVGMWDQQIWEYLSERSNNLHEDCKACPYLAVCQGGCMMQTIQEGSGPYGKPGYCASWKALFKRIDDEIMKYDEKLIKRWIKRVS